MHDDRASSCESYFVTYWWVLAALSAIGTVTVALLYFEHVSGTQLVDWCSAICAMFGLLIGALLIVLTRSLRGWPEDDGTTAHLRQLETRVDMLEEAQAPRARTCSCSTVSNRRASRKTETGHFRISPL
jgi:hypothetical protein